MTTISELNTLFDRQKKAFAANPNPTLKQREDRLDAVTSALTANRKRIQDTLREDFSVLPDALAQNITPPYGDVATDILSAITGEGA